MYDVELIGVCPMETRYMASLQVGDWVALNCKNASILARLAPMFLQSLRSFGQDWAAPSYKNASILARLAPMFY